MSLTEVLQVIRNLSAKEQEQVRQLLNELDHSRIDRFQYLRGSAKDASFTTLELEDFKAERREVWKGLSE